MFDSTIGFWGSWPGRLLLSSVLFLLFAVGPAAFAQKGIVHLKVRQTASQSLTLIKPTDPDFESTLDTYFPGVSLEDGYRQAIRPFLVIVRNENYMPAAAYAITWTLHYPDGSARLLRAMFVNRPLMQRVALTYIPSEAVRLISPLFNVDTKGYEWYLSFGQMFPAEHFPPLNGATSVDVGVDGVVYSDGSFIGADNTHILQRYVMARFAERDEVLAALNLISSSTAPPFMIAQQLQQMVNQQVEWEVKAYQFTLLARYVRARGRSAQDLQRILRDRGLSGLEGRLQTFVNRSGGNTNPSMFGRVYQKLSDNDPRVFGNIRSWIQHQLQIQAGDQ